MSECERFQQMISELLDGELTEVEQAELQAHMADCPDCAAMYDAFAEVSEALKAEAESEPLPAALHENIMAKVRVAEKAKKTHGTIVRLRPILAAAACLVVLAGTVLALRSNSFRMGKSESSGAAPAVYSAGTAESIQESAIAEGGQQILFAKAEDAAAPESVEAEVDSAAAGEYCMPEEPAVGDSGATTWSSKKVAAETNSAAQREAGTAVIVVRVTAQAETGTLTAVVTDPGDQAMYTEGDSVTVLIPAPGEYAPDTLLEVVFSTTEQRQDGSVKALEINAV